MPILRRRPGPRGSTICTLECDNPYCSIVFEKMESHLGVARGRRPFNFCSKSCGYHGHRTKLDIIGENIKIDENGCWIWSSYADKQGYGKFRYCGGWCRSHKTSFELFKEPVKMGLCVCHTCDKPRCCNPDHLFQATTQENTRDKVNKGRQQKGEEIKISKLNEDQVLEIRRLYALNDLSKKRKEYSSLKLAKMFNVYSTTILDVINRVTWKHI